MSEAYKTPFFLSDREPLVPIQSLAQAAPTTIDKCTGTPPPERLQLWNGLGLLANIDPNDEEEGHLAPSPLSLNTAKNFINKIPFFMPFPSHLMAGDDGNIIFRWKSHNYDWIATVAGSHISLAKRTHAGYELQTTESMPIYSSTIPDGIRDILVEMRSLQRS